MWRARSGELAHGGVETDVHPDALDPDRFDVVVRHRDGREDRVALRRVTVPELRDSCRKPLGPVRAWEVL
ncbi:hypothetical protein [Barrientosiimonas endolithica]|uniref:hypothetical protein n=1 Tax=Barrientosiimonas endolithica TaxID=1535208 RepID=UPI00259B136F|nr:hypothetical protein [Barrientosiimonas endolithica]